MITLGLALSLTPACAGDDLVADPDDPDLPGEAAPDLGPVAEVEDRPPMYDEFPPAPHRPELIIAGEPTARELRFAGDRMYWVEDADEGLYYLSSSRPHGGPTTVTAKFAERPFQFAVAGEHVYWSAPDSGRLLRQDLVGGEPVALFEDLAAAPLAVTAGARDVYFAAADGCVRRVGLEDGAVAEVACGEGTPVVLAASSDDPGDEHLFWGTAEGALYQAKAGSGSMVLHLAGESFDSQLLVDAAQVYWLNAGIRAVRAVARTDAEVRSIATYQYAPVGIAMDRYFVYFTTQSDGALKRVYKGGGAPSVLARDQADPGDLTLREGRAYWINEGDGTIMSLALP